MRTNSALVSWKLRFDLFACNDRKFHVSSLMQAKENFKVKDAFEALIRKVTSKNPNAGRSDGSGSVYGAGKIDK